MVAPPVEHQDPAAGASQLPGACGPYRTASDDYNFLTSWQLGVLRNFLKREPVVHTSAHSEEENSMFRSLFGFAVLAVLGIFLIRIVFGPFGFVVGLFIQLLIWAAIGFFFYLVIKVLSPSTASKIREVVTGR